MKDKTGASLGDVLQQKFKGPSPKEKLESQTEMTLLFSLILFSTFFFFFWK